MFSNSQLQKLYRYAYVLTADEHSAHDLVQDAVESCLLQPPKKTGALVSYSLKIIHNRFIDMARREKRFPHTTLDEELIELDADNLLLEEMVITSSELDTVWLKLDALEREILFLWAVEGYSTSQIADQLEISRGTILSRIHRLRKRLAKDNSGTLSSGGAV